MLKGYATVGSYGVQLLCALAIFIRCLTTWKRSHFLESAFLVFTVCDAFRTYTLWKLASGGHSRADSPFPALQTTSTVLYATQLALASWTPEEPNHGDHQGPDSSEPAACLLSLIFLSWLHPLLSYGRTYQIAQKDLNALEIHPSSLYHPPPPSKTKRETPGPSDSLLRDLMKEMPLRAYFTIFGSGFLALVLTAAILCQPLIIRGIVDYLQEDQHPSVGACLVLGLFLE